MKTGSRHKATGNRKKVKASAVALCAVLFALCTAAEAQQPKKVYLGYIEGKTIVIEWRSAEGSSDRQYALAVELAHLKVDVIVAGGTGDIRAAKQATDKIPIVMVNGGDATGNGFVATLARPGGNITGLSNLRPELTGKRSPP